MSGEIKKVMYPTDFSDISGKALEFIKRLKGSGIEEVVILHVIDERDLRFSYPYFFDEYIHDGDLEEKIRNEAAGAMERVEAELRKSGFEVRSRIELGVPLKVILRVEEEERPSVIVLGSHGKSNVEEMLLGSVSEKVVRKCQSPVLVVKR